MHGVKKNRGTHSEYASRTHIKRVRRALHRHAPNSVVMALVPSSEVETMYNSFAGVDGRPSAGVVPY